MLAVRCVPAAANSSTRHSLSFGVRRAGVHFLLHLCMMANGLSGLCRGTIGSPELPDWDELLAQRQ